MRRSSRLAASPSASAAPVAADAAPADDDDDEAEGNGLATGLGIAGLVAGLGGLVLGGLAYSRTRREPAAKA